MDDVFEPFREALLRFKIVDLRLDDVGNCGCEIAELLASERPAILFAGSLGCGVFQEKAAGAPMAPGRFADSGQGKQFGVDQDPA